MSVSWMPRRSLSLTFGSMGERRAPLEHLGPLPARGVRTERPERHARPRDGEPREARGEGARHRHEKRGVLILRAVYAIERTAVHSEQIADGHPERVAQGQKDVCGHVATVFGIVVSEMFRAVRKQAREKAPRKAGKHFKEEP